VDLKHLPTDIRLILGHLEKFRNTREPTHETHVLVRTGLLRPSGQQQFFEVPISCPDRYVSGVCRVFLGYTTGVGTRGRVGLNPRRILALSSDQCLAILLRPTPRPAALSSLLTRVSP